MQEVTEGEAIIHEVMERSSYLCHPDNGGHADGDVKTLREQPMVADLDYLLIITSLREDFSINRVARLAATSIQGGCQPVIILTEADLCPNKEESLAQARPMNDAWDVFCVNTHTGEGMVGEIGTAMVHLRPQARRQGVHHPCRLID
ncbi:MAG: GTPase RsgA [Clostridiales bacterium]|nr:GTPase RsgA [Clostridiales bacterium]